MSQRSVVHAAVSNADGEAEFIDVTSGLTQMCGLAQFYPKRRIDQVRNHLRHKEQTVKFPTVRVDTLLARNKMRNIDYCSIDVEGAERAVLSIENGPATKEASLASILEAAGYQLIDVGGADEIWVK